MKSIYFRASPYGGYTYSEYSTPEGGYITEDVRTIPKLISEKIALLNIAAKYDDIEGVGFRRPVGWTLYMPDDFTWEDL